MVSIDIETIGPKLKGIKLRQLEPNLIASVLELAEDYGYDITITLDSDLHFLFHIYKAEQARDKKNLKILKKAENLILTLSGLYSLHHEGKQGEQKKEEKKPFRHGMMEESVYIGSRIRALFESIGITGEKEMCAAVELLGEAKIENRVGLLKNSPIGDNLVKGIFGEHPETIRIVDDHEFRSEIRAVEDKKKLLDAWKKINGKPPIWADYSESPSALLVDFCVLCKELGIEGESPEEESPPQEALGKSDFLAFMATLGYKISSEEGALTFDKGGKILTISHAEIYHPAAIAGLLNPPSNEQEKTAPAAPAAIHAKKGSSSSDSLSKLSERGIDVSRLSLEIESRSNDPLTDSRTKDRQRFDSNLSFLHDRIMYENLENELNECLGSKGLRISKIGYLVGATGVFELVLSSGEGLSEKKLYFSAQDMQPAVIGKDVAEATGFASYRIWANPYAKYALSEDARDVGRRGEVKIRLPGKPDSETVTTLGAAIFKEDLVLRPNPEDNLHADFFRAMADGAQRKEILLAIASYLEMSRRALLPDRRPVNTYLLRVEKDSVKRFTFQPMDLDGLGNFIGSNRGKTDFTQYNADFHKAAADFIIQLHEGMLRACAVGIIPPADVPSVGRLLSELSEVAIEPIAEDSSSVRKNRNDILKSKDGKHIGVGFDAAHLVGKSIPIQGKNATVERNDGRVPLDSEKMIEVIEEAASSECHRSYTKAYLPSLSKRISDLPSKIANIASSISEAISMPESSTEEKSAKEEKIRRLRHLIGGELAFSIAYGTRAFDLSQAEDSARRMIFGP